MIGLCKRYWQQAVKVVTIITLSLFAHIPAYAADTAYKDSSSCAFKLDWFSSPALPTEVTGSGNCRFQQFMWQSFAYLVSPTSSAQVSQKGLANFQTWMPSYGIFVAKNLTPAPWGNTPKANYCSTATKEGVIYSNLTLQAGVDQALIDPAIQRVYYGIAVNKPAYDFITQCDLYRSQCGLTLAPDLLDQENVVNIPKNYPKLAFPVDAVEIKTSWKLLTLDEIASRRFFIRPGMVKSEGSTCRPANLGLVGMHIVSKTAHHPEFIWGTFEHRNNAPNCSDLAAASEQGQWNFLSAECNKQDANCVTNQFLGKDKPTEVCRYHPWGNPTQGTWPNNLNCSSQPPPAYICSKGVQENVIKPNTKNLIAINADASKQLKSSADYTLWSNYELVGNVWTLDGILPPTLQVQEGSLSAANTTMETYVQNGVADITNPYNCFSCHNLVGKTQVKNGGYSQPVELPPAGLSHIFNLLELNSGGCDNGQLPAACASYYK